jgi:hypothetical protein
VRVGVERGAEKVRGEADFGGGGCGWLGWTVQSVCRQSSPDRQSLRRRQAGDDRYIGNDALVGLGQPRVNWLKRSHRWKRGRR